MHVKRLLAAASLLLGSAAGVGAQDDALRLAVPPDFIENGLTQHLLPRFRFRTRIRVEPVTGGAADIALVEGGGVPVFSEADGASWGLEIVTGDAGRAAQGARFLDWLESEPGRAAIAAFEIDGVQAYLPGAAAVEAAVPVVVEGDADLGRRLALAHCGRCHVVDGRNPFGGIGSTPSFPAMRSQADWQPRFAAFWTFNPHPAFTQIEGVTPPFHPERPPPIAPLELSPEEAEAITAFVATLSPKDLGAEVEAR